MEQTGIREKQAGQPGFLILTSISCTVFLEKFPQNEFPIQVTIDKLEIQRFEQQKINTINE
jgi:hypothetical protein